MDVNFKSSVTVPWLSKSMSLFLGNTLSTLGISSLQFTLETVQNKKNVQRERGAQFGVSCPLPVREDTQPLLCQAISPRWI